MSEPAENRLKNSSSPYLRSAAHQPVDWYEWGDEAFARARADGKPILLDIGAVWCHWCHVIDRESYENPEIAAIINRNYVPVKVDRDERPDVDARYQAAVGAIAGQGGWPLTAFLTPDGKPFFGGTYFPPDDAMGRPGFKRILHTISETFRSRRGDVDQSATDLEAAVAQAESFTGSRDTFDPSVVDAMVDAIVRKFDLRHGGFGQAPKFPHASAIDLLLEQYQATAEAPLLEVAEKTLTRMASGGVYDQLAGGFHRYSVDERWLVPHFEKMSYDNSELLKNYLHGWQVTGNPFLRETAEGIIDWVLQTLSDAERGGFYASQDADYSLDDDGDYFTWTLEELRAALTAAEAQVMEAYYDVAVNGEMHHDPAKNVLWLARTPEEIAHQLRMAEPDVRLMIARAKGKMLATRLERPTPTIDKTVYVSWNAMFISAFLEAARVLRRADCREFALKTLDRILDKAWDPTRGFAHRLEDGAATGAAQPRLDGMLDDQVFIAAALLDAYEATLERRYFDAAERVMQLTIEKYVDADAGGFFDRSSDAAPLQGLNMRRKPVQDSPTPGTNAVAAIVLGRLDGFTGKAMYRDAAEKTLEAFAGLAPEYGLFAATYGLAALLHVRRPLQVVITGAAGDAQAAALEETALGVYRFGMAVLRVTPQSSDAAGLAPALRETVPHLRMDVPQALVCAGTMCHPPVTTASELKKLLAEAAAGSQA
jgi:uncharacterized protein